MNRRFTATALLFDRDGVLADSTHAVIRSWEAWAACHGLDPQLAIANGHGRPSIEAIRITPTRLYAISTTCRSPSKRASPC
jgi:beta-phosphoglucomutase-like phosphatase (HAD superfamily)